MLAFQSSAAVLSVTPAEDPEFPSRCSVWIPGGATVSNSMGAIDSKDSFTGKIPYKLSKTPESGDFSVKYAFEIPADGLYEFFAAIIRQGKAHSSPVEFRFDDGEWTSVIPAPESAVRKTWGISNALVWESLGEHKMNSGKHSLELRITSKSKQGNWSFMCDGIVALQKGIWKNVKISELKLSDKSLMAGKNMDISFQSEGPAVLASISLCWNDETVLTKNMTVSQGLNKLSINLPEFLGQSDAYSLKISPLEDASAVIFSKKLPPYSPFEKAMIPLLKDVKLSGSKYEFTISDKAESVSACVALFSEGKLYAVAELAKSSGELPPEILKYAAGRKAFLRFMFSPAIEGNFIEKDFSLPGAVLSAKPLNYGIFKDRHNISHFWYMSRDYEYVFDNKLYFPVGGMWCSSTLISPARDLDTVKQTFAKDMDVIRKLREGGVNDVYLNLSTRAPLWVRQAFIDMLERENVNYGYQLNGGSGSTIRAFFITREKMTDDAPKFQSLIHGTYEKGKLSVFLPKTYKLSGLLVFPSSDPSLFCRFVPLADKEGQDRRSGIIDLETVQDFADLRKISLPIELPLADGAEVLIHPQIDAKMHHSDVWDQENFRKVKENLSWIASLKWGKNLRCFIDPLSNETNMVNATENLRQYTDSFNADFAERLKLKYHDIKKLQDAWKLDVQDFAEASRLIPLRLKNDLYFADPESGKVYRTELKTSMAWPDYQDILRESYADHADEIAIYLKSLVNVPIVFKSVGVIGEKMSISRKYLGYDAVGFECYFNQGIPEETGGGASRAEAEASSHSMWKVGTELGHSAAVGNDGVKFFKDAQEVRNMAESMLRLGVRGFYFFGVELQPAKLWQNHNYYDSPEALSWIASVKKDYVLKYSEHKPTPKNYVFPGGHTWWWWTTRFNCIYGYEDNLIPQSARLGTSQDYFSSTEVLPEDFDAVIVNLPDAPFSLRHAGRIAEAINSGRTLYYIGQRKDIGAIPALDSYFTQERISFADGSIAQVLKAEGGAEVLAAENGKAWALRKGNLTIVSRTPAEAPKNNADEFLKYLSGILAVK